MSLAGTLKARKALKAYQSGKEEEALSLFAEADRAGLDDPKMQLSYATILIRTEHFPEAREHLKKIEKLPGFNKDQKAQLFMYYAVCCYKMGEIEKGIHLLERQHEQQPIGMIYQTLGYLYVEQGSEKAVPYNQEAVEYDDEDSICLDNLAQSYYRVEKNKEAARPWFEKALAQKSNQIDTLWFLSRYDIEEGRVDDAIEKLETALEGRFSVLNHVTKAEVQEELDRLKTLNRNGSEG
mgnify:CR=1 FL=1